MNSLVSAAIVRQLENGLTAIYHPIAATDAVTVDIWVRAGGRQEPPELLGVSHFLEHMIFKGTDRLSPGELDREVESRGGITNAATSQDYTHFYITVAAADLADTLPYLTEVVTHASIPEGEFQRERQVVIEEIRRSQDNPDHRAHHLLTHSAYTNHPYGRPVLGTVDSLMALTPEQMRAYHRSWYRPDRMTVVMVGNFELDWAEQLVEQQFGDLPVGGVEVPRPSVSSEPPLEGVRRVETTEPRLEQARLIVAWPSTSVAAWDDACGLDLLASVLGDGRSSRLVQLLREERGWVRGIGSSSAVHLDAGLFYISAYLDASRTEMVEATILQEVRRLQQELISPEELERARRILTNELVFSTESPSQLARVYGFYHFSGGLELADRYLECIRTATPESLRQLALRYLPVDRYCITLLAPEEAVPIC
ncbi:pitrilysin family protein [Synechococcus sp. PCC 7336]|uniref:M16 family metallopeptidase n=1 Tax=Synechococcus sp. PCC 7336 TaxID=195250 RepID=UPI0003484A4D|nr:pitrilysin family protein [Synechococcus sp. PCC 7336]